MSRKERLAFFAVLTVALIASAGLIGVIGGNSISHTPSAEADVSQTGQHAITVGGEGRVYATPDTGQVTLGVQSQAADLTSAQNDAAKRMSAIQSAVKGKGVPDNKIKTVSYNISINRDPKSGTQVTGYTVSDIVMISVKPVDQVGAVIQAALDAGANQVQGISFTLENSDAAVQQARQQAMDDARNKAQQLAQLGGVTLGQPILINEGVSTPTTPQPMNVAAPAAASGSAAIPPVSSGETQVVVTVTVSYGF